MKYNMTVRTGKIRVNEKNKIQRKKEGESISSMQSTHMHTYDIPQID